MLRQRNIPQLRTFAFINQQEYTGTKLIDADIVLLGSNNDEDEVKVIDGKLTVESQELILEKGFSVEKGAEFEWNNQKTL